jgi:DNA replication protein DnaC
MIFDFDRCLAFMVERGCEQFGDHFRIFPDDHGLIFKLMVYAIRDQENAERLNLNLQKGIMLTGPVGCGKTSLMKLLRFFMVQPETYVIKSCREISFEFIAKGFEVIHKYSALAPDAENSKVYCFDDLGTEQNLKYYGNECNVMAEILLNRYERFISHGIKTHITTNLSASEIESFYGNRVRSRMREMFNVIAFDKESKDKRK